ncbi:hypothetical protein V6N13_021169 [Hibiscus sabdariffa]|uniref:Seed biotin-containing protein SBP65 n=1 Tax=Hibiscus sabdariffa TaxID=183260 RepID=A0ABR2EVN9_9ROSI
MASDQLRRRGNNPSERDVRSEENRVPKMATHFDSLAEKAKQPDAGVARQTGDINAGIGRGKQVEERAGPNYAVGKVQVSVVPGQERGASMESKAKHESDKERRHSTETAGQRRNIDKAKESANQADYTKEKGQQATETAQYATEKGGQVTDTVRRAAQQAAEKGGQAKDTIVEGAKKTSQYIAEKGTETKDTVAETLSSAGRTSADYTAPKMEQAGEVAGDMKDRAVVAGWNAAHYTTEKAVEGTKAAARMVEGAAEYAGQKSKELAATSLRAAKDSASAAGETMKDYTARKKEEAARELEAKRSAEEESKGRPSETETPPQCQEFPRKTKEKIEETAKPGRERSSETRQHQQQLGDFPRKTEEEIEETSKPGRERPSETRQQLEDFPRKTQEKIEETTKPSRDAPTQTNKSGRDDETQSGVLGAIAETIVEIAQNTANLVNIAPGDDQTKTQSGPRRD